MIISKKRYLQIFGICVIALAIVRAVFPSIANGNMATGQGKDVGTDTTDCKGRVTEEPLSARADTSLVSPRRKSGALSTARFFNEDGTVARHRIYSVPNFGNAFPDQNDVQLVAAQKYGVKPVQNRLEAEKRKKELVYVGSNPYFYVDNLKNSIPYLVPRASVLLQDIGRTFFDSLQVKGIPLHKIIVTSVLRTKDDVEKLRGKNGNATQNSCHLYGTTFDVCYNRYKTVEDPDGPRRRQVRNDTLKWVLSEVLNDARVNNKCFIKYEVHQGCFHITVK